MRWKVTSLKEAFKEIQRLSENPATRDIANSREKFLLDQIQYEQDARNKGLAEGREDRQRRGERKPKRNLS